MWTIVKTAKNTTEDNERTATLLFLNSDSVKIAIVANEIKKKKKMTDVVCNTLTRFVYGVREVKDYYLFNDPVSLCNKHMVLMGMDKSHPVATANKILRGYLDGESLYVLKTCKQGEVAQLKN